MSLVNAKCKNCGGQIQMDDAQQVGFCMYCGSKFIVKDELQRIIFELQGQVRIDKDEEIRNLLTRAKEKIADYIRVGNFYDDEGIKSIINSYLERVLDLQPDNKEARDIIAELMNFKSVYKASFIITREKQNLYNGAARVAINGEETCVPAGKTVLLELPMGLYEVAISVYGISSRIKLYLKGEVNMIVKWKQFAFPFPCSDIEIQGAEILKP